LLKQQNPPNCCVNKNCIEYRIIVVVVPAVDTIDTVTVVFFYYFDGHNAPNSIECSTRHEISLHLDDHQSYEVMFTEISSTLEIVVVVVVVVVVAIEVLIKFLEAIP